MHQLPASLVVVNAKIRTMDRLRPWASAIAVRDGRFVAVGADEVVGQLVGPDTDAIDARGAVILPGLFDSHCHAFEAARADLFEIRFSSSDDFIQIIDKVAEVIARDGKDIWLRGAGWSLQRVPELTAEHSLSRFDEVTGERPVVLRDSSHHAVFANSAAMKLAGLTSKTADSKPDTIVKNKNGNLSGLFLEESCTLLDRAIPALSDDDKRRAAIHAVNRYNSVGVTGFTHALTSETVMRIFKALDDEANLNAWVATCIAMDSILTPERDGIGLKTLANRKAYRSQHVAVDYVKYFMDGVPGARTAAFHHPYAPGPDGTARIAVPMHSVSELCELIRPLDSQGLHVKIHAVGDRAIRDTLDAIEIVRSENGPGPQHSIAHLSYISQSDIPRLKRLDVVADLCPPLWYPNGILSNNAAVLGDDRNERAWSIADIARSGAAVVAGTDWPIAPSPNPWPGIGAMVTRRDPYGVLPGTFRIDQAISLEEALPLCSLNVAESMGFGRVTGSISEGKCADFIVLDRDIFSIEPSDIANTKVVQTYFFGRLVHSADTM